MRIESIALKFPSKCVSNEDLFDQIRELNASAEPSSVERYCRQVRLMLTQAGSRTRFYRDVEGGETAIALITDAVDQSLREAHLERKDIDLLIYCGVGRGFAEPSSAAFVLHALGVQCEGFDILDACMSWVRALQVANSFLAAGAYSRVLIVNGEFNIYECGFPEVLHVENAERLPYLFPSFTIGEAASATVVTKSDDRWRFSFRSRPDLAPLCSLPLSGYAQFSLPDERVGLAGVRRLVAFSSELAEAGTREIFRLIGESIDDPQQIDWYVPHVPAHSIVRKAAEHFRMTDRVVCDGFPEYGNLVSASLPAALWRMLGKGQLVRGNRVALCPVSAGMSFSVVEFVY